MMPDYKGKHLSPYGSQFNMNAGTQPQETARFNGYAAGPWNLMWPVNYAAGNNYAGMSTGSNTNMAGAAADTSAGDTAADAGAGDSGGDGGGDGGGGL